MLLAISRSLPAFYSRSRPVLTTQVISYFKTMANPRQRRKARSGQSKVRLSKFANKKLKKVTPRNFPGPLSNAYDPKKTPRQNYTRLGLLSGKLDPRLAGGIEKNTDLKNNWLQKYKKVDEFELLQTIAGGEEAQEDTEDIEDSDDSSSIDSRHSSNHSHKLSKGEGRIIRDSTGKIIKVIIGDESETELEPTPEDSSKIVIHRKEEPGITTPWGKPLEIPSYEQEAINCIQPSAPVLQGIGYENPRQGKVLPKTKFVEELEKIASDRQATHIEAVKRTRHLSENQKKWLVALVEKHGLDNFQAMARDLKLNKQQKTEGEIRHLLSQLTSQCN